MNLEKMIKMQKELDEHIINKHNELQCKNNLGWKILALQVELGELANEWRGFKKWSNDKEPRVERMLEEYVDCLHFILSIGLEKVEFRGGEIELKTVFYVDDTEVIVYKGKNIESQFNQLFLKVGLFYDAIQHNTYGFKNKFDGYYAIFGYFMGLGEMLGFNRSKIGQAYFAKNEINHKRQEEGY